MAGWNNINLERSKGPNPACLILKFNSKQMQGGVEGAG